MCKTPQNMPTLKVYYCYILFAVLQTSTNAQSSVYHGVLINGQWGGTQLYDPFNTPHARGNLQLGLQTFASASGSAAAIQGEFVYSASGDTGECEQVVSTGIS